ncbi:MAG TPA: hypothetical protein VES66_02720 [Terriglobales bacterium]|nr:hypothetical protein [Terriglobales bacterium]
MAIRTIFSMAEDCARGERLGWLEFVRDFAGIARSLLAHYFPTLAQELDGHVVALFRRAGAQGGAWFAGLSFSNEREFMMAFRDLVFAYGREQEHVPAPQISLDQLRTTMQDLTLLERELLWLFIKGYDAPRITAIMMNAAATAEAVQRIAAERLGALVPGTAPGVLAVSARVLMELAEQSKTDQCTSLKTFNNLVNGQISWRERELAEEHMSNCFYCIDRFTAFQEMVRLRKDVARLEAPQVEAILAQLPLAAAKPSGMLSRLFAGR